MKKTVLIPVAAAAILASSVAFAAEGPPKFKAADTNGDGAVDATEFAATKLKRDFSKLDKDGNGSLNEKEYKAALEEDCE